MAKKTIKKEDYGRGSGIAHPTDVHVGERIKIRRRMLGLSQEKLADKIGLTFQQIQKYERAVNRVSASKLLEFSAALNVPIEYFYQGLNDFQQSRAVGLSDNEQEAFDNNTHESFLESQMFTEETMELLKEYYAITSKEKRKDIFNIVKTFSENMRDE